jgi:hypothetical protein
LPKHIEIVERTALNLGTGRRQRASALVRTCESQHAMARSNQILDDRRSHPARGTRYEHTHDEVLQSLRVTNIDGRLIVVKW